MKMTLKYALLAVAFAAIPASAKEAVDCAKVTAVVKQAVQQNPTDVLDVVAKQIAANEGCACEVVKAAIIASDADKKLVADIVNTAILEGGDDVKELVFQCAVAVAPDALADVQKVMAKFDYAAGDSVISEKGAITTNDSPKGGPRHTTPVASNGNPLDFPGASTAGGGNNSASSATGGSIGSGPTVGGPGGFPLLPNSVPIFFPPIVTPPSTTAVGTLSTEL